MKKLKGLKFIIAVAIVASLPLVNACNNDDEEPLSDDAEILTFIVENEILPADIDSETASVTVEVPPETDRSMLSPQFTVSEGATAVPASETEGDYSVPVTISITAQDGVTVKEWTINVLKELDPEVFCDFGLCEGNPVEKQKCIEAYNTCAAASPENTEACANIALGVCEERG